MKAQTLVRLEYRSKGGDYQTFAGGWFCYAPSIMQYRRAVVIARQLSLLGYETRIVE